MKFNKLSGLILATAAASLFVGSNITLAAESAESATIHCEGVNSCKGTTACKTASNDCKGQNACKGHGFLSLSQAECDATKQTLRDEMALLERLSIPGWSNRYGVETL